LQKQTATLMGLLAIGLWSFLALLTAMTGDMPPFQVAAITFLIGGLCGAFSWFFRPQAWRAMYQPVEVWIIGIFGLFGYHALYFAALKRAPPAEAGLINYLWPLLIVLLSSHVLRERLNILHILGALSGLAGVIILVLGQQKLSFNAAYWPGYSLAFAAAFVWALYSIASRRFSAAPTDAVTGFCLVTALLSAICHKLFEQTLWPSEPVSWLALLVLGMGPVGLAFYLWDMGVKHGDIRFLGAASYGAALLSTTALVLAGYAEPSPLLGLSCLLIVAGSLMAGFADPFMRTVSSLLSRR
jgi:drug/metabolite transporter (DMT)-like permease